MSEETGISEDSQEPSMEDILASIRRILSENDEAKIAAVEAELHPEAGLSSDDGKNEDLDNDVKQNSGLELEAASAAETGPNIENITESSEDSNIALDAVHPSAREATNSVPPVMEAILDLTPDMIASEIISEPTAQTSTDVLSELAAAILDRRDLAVDATSQDMTLEGIVREMLKPILREWLDRNLPYLIERLVKREIDLMVNRAEKLEE